MIGKQVSHYKILEKLGEGGMGEVYLAEDLKLERKVAIKFLPQYLTKDKDIVERFIREAKAAAALNHPNIVTVYEIAQEHEQMFIVMEYVDGESLRDKINRGISNLYEIIGLCKQICEGLQEAHEAEIVHRDVKPENILIDKNERVKILDFGLAKLKGVSKLTREDSTMGTIHYMSPEQIQGKEVDRRSDIWSLGVVIYEMLTGKAPFTGDYEQAVIYSILHEEPEPVQKHRPDLPVEFIHVLDTALKKNPTDRYPSVEHLLKDLNRLKQNAAQSPPESQTPVIEQKITPGALSAKRLWISAAMVLSLAVLGFLLLNILKKDENVSTAQQLQVTQITTHGRAKEAAISPDGKYIVHVMEENGKQSLWLRQVVTGSNVEILAPEEIKFIGLTFTNDGNYIYYVTRPLDRVYGTLYRLPALGGNALKVCEQVNSPITFSPDSKKLAFIRINLNPFKTDLILFDISGEKEEILSSWNSPGQLGNWGISWSPDGGLIACEKIGPQPEKEPYQLIGISVMDGNIKKLFPRRWGSINQIAWLNDGSGLIISAADKSTGYFYRLWFVSYPDGQAHLITPELNNYLSVSLTRDMTTILTTRSEWLSNVWVSSTDSPDQVQQITSGSFAGFMGVAWTPDGRLVYGSRDFKLWIINRDGSRQKLLSGNELNNWHPAVSPDGRYIVFQSWRGGAATNRIWRTDLDGGNPRALTEGDWDDFPQVSPDGKWVIYQTESTGQPTLWKVSINGGNPTRLLNHFSSNPAISRDGKWLACIVSDKSVSGDQFQIIVMPFEGGEPTFYYQIPADIVGWNDLHWTPDGKGLAYLMSKGGARNIWIKALDDSPAVQLTHLTHQQIFHFDWSKDGNYLAYASGVMDDDVVLIRNFK